jgi:signal transduction histidine kinase
VVIRIIDNGPGMTEQVRLLLFDPFFTTKPVGQGTGLGLSISYQIVVAEHTGQLRCVSAPGRGTEFIIEIPILQANRKLTANIEAASDPQTLLAKNREIYQYSK